MIESVKSFSVEEKYSIFMGCSCVCVLFLMSSRIMHHVVCFAVSRLWDDEIGSPHVTDFPPEPPPASGEPEFWKLLIPTGNCRFMFSRARTLLTRRIIVSPLIAAVGITTIQSEPLQNTMTSFKVPSPHCPQVDSVDRVCSDNGMSRLRRLSVQSPAWNPRDQRLQGVVREPVCSCGRDCCTK